MPVVATGVTPADDERPEGYGALVIWVREEHYAGDRAWSYLYRLRFDVTVTSTRECELETARSETLRC